LSAEQLLSSVPESDTVIVADLEAGIGTLTRLPEASVCTTLVIVEPTPRSIDIGQRAVLVALERQQGRVAVVANKVADAEDEARVRAAFGEYDVVVVPADPVVAAADRKGASPMDIDPDAPAVTAITDLASLLVETDSPWVPRRF
jgi:CO dehydrogenase maturation factor